MNGMTIAGLDVLVVGGILCSDYKALGMGNPTIGIVIVAAGLLIALLGLFPLATDRTRQIQEGSGP